MADRGSGGFELAAALLAVVSGLVIVIGLYELAAGHRHQIGFWLLFGLLLTNGGTLFWGLWRRRNRAASDQGGAAPASALPASSGDESRNLDAVLSLAQTQILAQVADEASLDGRTLGLMALNGALLGGALAAKSLLGHDWRTPLIPIGLSTGVCLWSVFKKSSAYGPRPIDFFQRFGGLEGIQARGQLLAELDFAYSFNSARIRAKELRLQFALGVLVLGLVVAALLIAGEGPTNMKTSCASGQNAQHQSKKHRAQCPGLPGSRSSAPAG